MRGERVKKQNQLSFYDFTSRCEHNFKRSKKRFNKVFSFISIFNPKRAHNEELLTFLLIVRFARDSFHTVHELPVFVVAIVKRVAFILYFVVAACAYIALISTSTTVTRLIAWWNMRLKWSEKMLGSRVRSVSINYVKLVNELRKLHYSWH